MATVIPNLAAACLAPSQQQIPLMRLRNASARFYGRPEAVCAAARR